MSKVTGRRRTRTGERTYPGLPSPKTLDLVDLFLFLLDSRIPRTSLLVAEPYLRKKRRVYVLTKPDLADPVITERWVVALNSDKTRAFPVECNTGKGVGDLLEFVEAKRKELEENWARKMSGLTYGRPIRLMLFGLPNVGKSSLANRLLGVRKAPFGAKPGLTRGANWLKGKGSLEVLDTPGVIDASRVDRQVRLKLAATWALPESAYDEEEVALFLASKIRSSRVPRAETALDTVVSRRPASDTVAPDRVTSDTAAPDRVASDTIVPGGLILDTDASGSEWSRAADHLEFLTEFGRGRGFLIAGGQVDMTRTYRAFIKAFREGALGRISLEEPESSPPI